MNFAHAFDPIRALKTSWTLIQAAPAPLLIGGILLMITGGGGGDGGASNIALRGHDVDWRELRPLIPLIIGVACCLGLACFLFSSWLLAGFAHSIEEVLRKGTGEVGTVFDARGRFFDMILVRVLSALLVIAAVLPFGLVILVCFLLHHHHGLREGPAIALGVILAILYVPVLIYIALGLSLCEPAVALETLSPFGAIQRSWSLASGHRFQLFIFFLATGIFSLLGVCLCCVGVFLTGTMSEIARFESYLCATRPDDYQRWWITTRAAPPLVQEPWSGAPSSAPPAPPIPPVPSGPPLAPPPPPGMPPPAPPGL